MSNIHSENTSLQNIVKNISKDSYLVPKFQRGFVWKTKDICDLGDSIIRGYPISSLLIMPENGTLNVSADSLSKEGCDENNTKNDKLYILDGQQRLKSISKLFLNFDSKNEYYFDLLAILMSKFPQDNIFNDKGIKELHSKVKEPNDIFCRDFKKSPTDNSEKPTRHYNRFISGKKIITEKYTAIVNKFLEGFKEATEDNIDKYVNYLGAILGSVNGYSIPATTIGCDSELGVVIRVFEKINSTGKKLTLFDLINAKSFQVNNQLYKIGLSDYLTVKISDAIKNNIYLQNGVYGYLKYNKGSNNFERLDRIVRILEVANLLKKDVTPSILQSSMLEREPKFWFEEWDNHGIQILEIICWMENEGLINLGQPAFLEYVTAVFLASEKSFSSEKFKLEIKKYALYLLLINKSFNKSDLLMVQELYKISKQITNSHESEKNNYVSPSSSPNLSAGKILSITTSKAEFKAIMNIFYIERVDANFTVDITGHPIKDRKINIMDNHHIYPKSRVPNFSTKSIFNSIANCVLVNNVDNRESIKDKLPKVYFLEIKSKEKGSFWCEKNLIDIDEVIKVEDINTAETFLRKRAEKIANIINSYF